MCKLLLCKGLRRRGRAALPILPIPPRSRKQHNQPNRRKDGRYLTHHSQHKFGIHPSSPRYPRLVAHLSCYACLPCGRIGG